VPFLFLRGAVGGRGRLKGVMLDRAFQ